MDQANASGGVLASLKAVLTAVNQSDLQVEFS